MQCTSFRMRSHLGFGQGLVGMAIVTSLFFCCHWLTRKQNKEKKTQESYNANDYMN